MSGGPSTGGVGRGLELLFGVLVHQSVMLVSGCLCEYGIGCDNAPLIRRHGLVRLRKVELICELLRLDRLEGVALLVGELCVGGRHCFLVVVDIRGGGGKCNSDVW